MGLPQNYKLLLFERYFLKNNNISCRLGKNICKSYLVNYLYIEDIKNFQNSMISIVIPPYSWFCFLWFQLPLFSHVWQYQMGNSINKQLTVLSYMPFWIVWWNLMLFSFILPGMWNIPLFSISTLCILPAC